MPTANISSRCVVSQRCNISTNKLIFYLTTAIRLAGSFGSCSFEVGVCEHLTSLLHNTHPQCVRVCEPSGVGVCAASLGIMVLGSWECHSTHDVSTTTGNTSFSLIWLWLTHAHTCSLFVLGKRHAPCKLIAHTDIQNTIEQLKLSACFSADTVQRACRLLLHNI